MSWSAPRSPETLTPWRQGLATELDSLGRWFEGRLAPDTTVGDELVPAVRLLTDEQLLARTIYRQVPDKLSELPAGHEDRRKDPRILASRFARLYSNAVTGAALVGLARGIGLDLSPQHCAIVFRGTIATGVILDIADDEILRCAQRPATLSASGRIVDTVADLRAFVWSALYGNHIAPLYARVLDQVNVSAKLLWSNSAEMVGLLYDAAEEYLTPDRAAPIIADSWALLNAGELPGVPGPNPLRGRLEWVPHDDGGGFPRQVQQRRMCCLVMHLEDRYGRLCQNCPYLPLDEQVALIRERHGLSQSDPRGPAERQATIRGLAWLGRKT